MWLRLRWLLLLLMLMLVLLGRWRGGGEGGGGGLLVVVMLLLVLVLREMSRMLLRVLTWWRQRIGRGRVVGRMRVHGSGSGSGCTEQLWLQGETAGSAQNHVMLHLKTAASHLKGSIASRASDFADEPKIHWYSEGFG